VAPLTPPPLPPPRSKLAAYDAVQKAKGSVDKLEKDERDLQQKATAVDQTIANLMGEMQKLEAKKANLQHILEQSAKEQVSKKSGLEQRTERSEALGETLPGMRLDLEGLQMQITRLEEEIGTTLSATLSSDERKTLTELHAAQKEQEEAVEAETTKLEEASAEKNKLQSLLKDNLSRQREELLNSLTPAILSGGNTVGSEISERKERLESRRADLEIAERSAEACEQRVTEAKAAQTEAKTNGTKFKTQLEELKAKEMSTQQAVEEAGESAERLLNKRSMCVSKRELYMKKIQELGSLPSSELATHAELPIKELMKELEKSNKGLKKYSHVNKKAYDQYVNFSEQRESLLSRKEELDVGAKKVQELIESLDTQKDEAINRTFRGVSAHFKDVFKELCPEGTGELIMKTALDEEDDDDTATTRR